jgi:hypothetical protein
MLGSDAARAAAAAAPRPVDEDRLARLQTLGSPAERGNGAGDLVAERERQLVWQRSGAPVHEMKIGMAEPRSGDPDEQLTGAWFGHGNIDEPSGSLPCREPDCLHRHDVSI